VANENENPACSWHSNLICYCAATYRKIVLVKSLANSKKPFSAAIKPNQNIYASL